MSERPTVLEIVEWDDAETKIGWVDHDVALELFREPPPRVVTVGFVIHETEDSLWLASSIKPGGWGELSRIPAGMVRRREEVRRWP